MVRKFPFLFLLRFVTLRAVIKRTKFGFNRECSKQITWVPLLEGYTYPESIRPRIRPYAQYIRRYTESAKGGMQSMHKAPLSDVTWRVSIKHPSNPVVQRDEFSSSRERSNQLTLVLPRGVRLPILPLKLKSSLTLRDRFELSNHPGLTPSYPIQSSLHPQWGFFVCFAARAVDYFSLNSEQNYIKGNIRAVHGGGVASPHFDLWEHFT